MPIDDPTAEEPTEDEPTAKPPTEDDETADDPGADDPTVQDPPADEASTPDPVTAAAPGGVAVEDGPPEEDGAAGSPVEDGRVEDGHEPPRRRSTLRRVLVVLGIVALLAVAAWYTLIPYPWTLRTTNPEVTALMEQRIEAARAEGDSLEIDQRWVPLEEISDNLVRAVIVAEDYRFRLHDGIDWVSLAEEVEWTGADTLSWTRTSDLVALADAAHYVWTNRAELRGRSTLTQQLAKNLYYGTDRSLLRKVLEYVVAGRLERRLDKDRILELYLNIVEWGPGVFGAEAAAQTYFGRSASALTLPQAAALAGTLPHPLTSNPALDPGRMAWRQDLILDRLDPSRGLPDTPMPLPSPDMRRDFDAGIPAPRVPTIDPGGSRPIVVPIDTGGADSATVPVDTAGSDSVGVPIDTVGSGSMVVPIDTIESDSTVVPIDTIGR